MPRLYVGNLPRRVEERDIKKFFRDFGRVRGIDLKNGYGFVEMEDRRDAEDAIHDLDGSKLLGERVTVEMARSSIATGGGSSSSRYSSRYDRDSRDTYNTRRPIRSEHRIVVEELSTRVSWQDLKDLMRKVGEVTFADAHKIRPNEGVVEFSNRSDMKAAVDKFDGYELHGYKLKVSVDRKHGSSRRSRTRSKSRRRHRRRSTSRSRRSVSRTRSRSRSKRSSSRKRSRSRKRSTSRKRSHSRKRSTSRRRSHSKHKKSNNKRRSRSRKSTSRRKSQSDKRSKSPSESRSKSRSKSHSKSPSKSRSKSKNSVRKSTGGEEVAVAGTASRSPSAVNEHSRSRSASRNSSRSRSRSRSASEENHNGVKEEDDGEAANNSE